MDNVEKLLDIIDQHLRADAKMSGPVYYIQNCQGFGKKVKEFRQDYENNTMKKSYQ